MQEAFLIYEDQYDGEWDRGWYKFEEMFPDVNPARYTKQEALKILLTRFAYRLVIFDSAMAKSFFKVPEKEIKAAIQSLIDENILAECENSYILKSDSELLENYETKNVKGIFVIHRSDFLVRANENSLKKMTASLLNNPDYDHETLQYLFIDGEFHGATLGHFRYGPYDMNDIVCDLPDSEKRKQEVIQAVLNLEENRECKPLRFNGKAL